jgi:hypothetical protein
MWLDSASRLATLPDLVVSADEWACTFLKADFEGDVVVEDSLSPRHTGSHRMDGVYLASGPAFAARPAGEPASILDVAPTVLSLFGLAAPPDRSGRVLDVAAGPPPALRPASMAGAPAAADTGSADDEADVRERLRGLGYIE